MIEPCARLTMPMTPKTRLSPWASRMYVPPRSTPFTTNCSTITRPPRPSTPLLWPPRLLAGVRHLHLRLLVLRRPDQKAFAILDLEHVLLEPQRQTGGAAFERALHGRDLVGRDPGLHLRRIERLGRLDCGTEDLHGGISRRRVVIRILVEHRLVPRDEAGIVMRLQARPPAGVGDDPIGDRPQRIDELVFGRADGLGEELRRIADTMQRLR